MSPKSSMTLVSVAVWFIAGTGREVFQSHEELIGLEKSFADTSDHDDAAQTAN